MKMRALGGLAFLLATPPSWADDSNANHAVWGIGRTSCHGYSQARAAGEFTEYKVYSMGYLTAYNALTPNTYNVSGAADLNGVLAWLDDYCRKTPVDSFDHALRQMVTQMHESRVKKAPGAQTWGRQRPKD